MDNDNSKASLWKTNPKEYWRDWYWNRGGREKVLATRYIAEYKREQLKKSKAI